MITKHLAVTVPHQVTVDLGPHPGPDTDWHAMSRLAELEAAEQCSACFGDRGPNARALNRYRFTPYGASEEDQPRLMVNVLVGAAGR